MCWASEEICAFTFPLGTVEQTPGPYAQRGCRPFVEYETPVPARLSPRRRVKGEGRTEVTEITFPGQTYQTVLKEVFHSSQAETHREWPMRWSTHYATLRLPRLKGADKTYQAPGLGV